MFRFGLLQDEGEEEKMSELKNMRVLPGGDILDFSFDFPSKTGNSTNLLLHLRHFHPLETLNRDV